MNERQSRASSTAPLRRPRKTTLRNVDDDKQRERKRALDRKAQRASREKTRLHIAHLEKMVKILSEKNGRTATGELMQEMTRLHAEIERLRKIIEGIKSVLGTDVLESTGFKKASLSAHTDYPDSPDHEMKLFEGNSFSDDGISQVLEDCSSTMTQNQGDANENTAADMEVGDGLPEIPMETNCVREAVDQIVSLDKASVTPTTFTDHGGTLVVNPAPSCSLPSPMKTSIHTLPPPDFAQCSFWKKANSIYARIFDYDMEGISKANRVDSGALFKVVKKGWGSLTRAERENPVLQILEEVDQFLFWDLDPVSKIANMYKSHLILKYYFNAEKQNLELIPAWQRPVHSQRTRKHPLPIDFFPWPALRDRLIRHHHYYFATSDFSVHYRQNFKFHWPFGFDETYKYCPTTETYQISPLFARYYSDEKSWTLNKAFFEKFPEYTGEIPVHEVDPVASPLPSVSSVPRSVSPGLEVKSSQKMESSGLGLDECVMALFDELPPT